MGRRRKRLNCACVPASRACRRIDEPAVATALLAALRSPCGRCAERTHAPGAPGDAPRRHGPYRRAACRSGRPHRTVPGGGMASRVGAIRRLSCHRAPVSLRPMVRQAHQEERPAGLSDEAALRIRPAPVRQVRAGGRPPFGRDGVTVQARPTPVDRTGRVSALPQNRVPRRPHIGAWPSRGTPPARHAAAAARLSIGRRPVSAPCRIARPCRPGPDHAAGCVIARPRCAERSRPSLRTPPSGRPGMFAAFQRSARPSPWKPSSAPRPRSRR